MNDLYLSIAGMDASEWREPFERTLSMVAPDLSLIVFEPESLGGFGGRKSQVGLSIPRAELATHLNTIASVVATMMLACSSVPAGEDVSPAETAPPVEQNVREVDRPLPPIEGHFECLIDGETGAIAVTIEGRPGLSLADVRACLDKADVAQVGAPTHISLKRQSRGG